ncbi:AbrB/MazE/SpoVT family DNA-binding domain-containing protein [Haloarchaeobius amylolyticus]|uniref:AbrB/MazE/SpoVT family DNA-binding domain-containing protein n=1 Tax=Haloarchaeobius amylolyticus TaxID=1198296 RepID=UPI00227103BA|nr:AbrB/MazE/SpoVT family DNA-binding domain-containing protein [Haloarchaeobius amylolyticus]
MSSDCADAESKVTGNMATIPARIRRELGIDNGDILRWHIDDDGTIRVRVVKGHTGTLDDFHGYDGDTETDVATDHDVWGVDTE